MKRSSAYTVILLLLVLIIALLGFLILRRKGPEVPVPTEPPVTTTAVQPPRETDPPAPTETPAPTEAPVFETRPPVETEEPVATPEPTPTPRPAAQGSCASSTGVGLNIRADWYTLPGGDKLQVDVYCVSYSVYSGAQWQSVQMTLGGQTYAADSKAISYDGQDQVSNLLASFTVDTPSAGTPISVTWNYKGSYSGKDLPAITATGAVTY